MSLKKENMTEVLQMLQKFAPDEIAVLSRRYQVLKAISLLEPVGRRTVSLSLDFSERTVRGETDKLSIQQLIEVSREGMKITEEGKKVLAGMEYFMQMLDGTSEKGKEIANLLGIAEAYIAEGDCEQSQRVKKEMGRIAAEVVLRSVSKESKIALTGGSTLADVVAAMPFASSKKAELVVPARGSLGGKLEQQADTLAAGLAEKLGAKYRLLYLPDQMSKSVLKELKQEPTIQETIQGMQEADVLLFGVGNALEMAEKRQVDDAVYHILVEKGAVAELLGYYLDDRGEIVYRSHSVGVQLEEVKNMRKVIAVAGGEKKAESLLAVCKKLPQTVLITDSSAAKEMIRLTKDKKKRQRLLQKEEKTLYKTEKKEKNWEE